MISPRHALSTTTAITHIHVKTHSHTRSCPATRVNTKVPSCMYSLHVACLRLRHCELRISRSMSITRKASPPSPKRFTKHAAHVIPYNLRIKVSTPPTMPPLCHHSHLLSWSFLRGQIDIIIEIWSIPMQHLHHNILSISFSAKKERTCTRVIQIWRKQCPGTTV